MQSTRRSPGFSETLLVSTVTNSSGPSERVRTWRLSETSASAAVSEVDLAKYAKVGEFPLPTKFNDAAETPANSLLAEEASAVTYDWDTKTLFVAGDGGTSIVQVSKTGQLIDSMTLAPGNSPQGTTFYDTEGLTYIGNEEFVITEERDRQIDRREIPASP